MTKKRTLPGWLEKEQQTDVPKQISEETLQKFSGSSFESKKRKFKQIDDDSDQTTPSTDDDDRLQKRLKFDRTVLNDIFILLNRYRRVVVFDVETSGFAAYDQILEIAAVELFDDQKTGFIFHTMVKNRIEIDEHASKVHGLDTSVLKNCPDTAHVIPNFLRFLDQSDQLVTHDTLLVSHNLAFDLRMLKQDIEFILRNEKLSLSVPDKSKAFCTMQSFKKLFGRNYQADLDSACHYFGISSHERKRFGHSALADAHLTAKVFLAEKKLVAEELAREHDQPKESDRIQPVQELQIEPVTEPDIVDTDPEQQQSTPWSAITSFFSKFF